MRADLIRSAIMLGQAIDRVLKEFGRTVLAAIPFGVDGRIAEPEVGRHVDDPDASRQLRNLGVGGGVRQAAKGDVDLIPIDLVGGDERRQAEACKMREHLGQPLAGMPLRDQGGDGNVGMARGQPDQVGAGIAAGAKHRGPDLGGC